MSGFVITTSSYRLLLDASSAWQDVGMSVHVVEDSSSDRCLAVVKHWLRDCSEHHPMCTHATLSPLPTQVINVGSSVDSRDPFLYETLSECARYMTLSYCWGDRHPIKTTQGSLSRYRGGIPWSDLPRTFQDAIDITHRLGIKYLWIDSLCTYSQRTTMKDLGILRFAPQVSEGFDFTHLVSQIRQYIFPYF